VDLYSTCREHIYKELKNGMRSQGISQFYLHTPRSSANRINHTCLRQTSFDKWKAKLWINVGLIAQLLILFIALH